jgi:hypothetical protein
MIEKKRVETKSEMLSELKHSEHEFHRFREIYLGLVQRVATAIPATTLCRTSNGPRSFRRSLSKNINVRLILSRN